MDVCESDDIFYAVNAIGNRRTRVTVAVACKTSTCSIIQPRLGKCKNQFIYPFQQAFRLCYLMSWSAARSLRSLLCRPYSL